MGQFGRYNGFGFGSAGSGGGGGGIDDLDNGLYIDGSTGKLGGTLIEQTEIELEDNQLIFQNAASGMVVQFIPASNTINIVSGGEVPMGLIIDGGSRRINLGDYAPAQNGTQFILDDDDRIVQALTTAGGMLYLDQASGLYIIGDVNTAGNDTKIEINDSSSFIRLAAQNHVMMIASLTDGSYNFGDLSGFGNATKMVINDSNRLFELACDNDKFASFSLNSGSFSLGDIDGFVGGYTLNLDFPGNVVNIEQDGALMLEFVPQDYYSIGDISNVGNGMNVNLSDDERTFTIGSDLPSPNRSLFLDQLNHVYQMGDLDEVANGTLININDTDRYVRVMSGGFTFLEIDPGSNIYRLGDTNQSVNGSTIQVDDTNQFFSFITGDLGSPFLSIDAGTGVYQMGDISALSNGTFFQINDAVKGFVITSTSGIMLRGNQTTNIYQFGDISTTLNGSRISIDDNTEVILLQSDNGITTTALPGGGQGKWKLGIQVAAAATLNTAQYIEVEVDGVTYKLATMN